jgi:hypothetical protein
MFNGLFFLVSTRRFRGVADWDDFFLGMILASIPTTLLMGLGAYLKRFKSLFVSSWILIGSTNLFMVLLAISGFYSQIQRDWQIANFVTIFTVLEACLGIGLAVLFVGRWRVYKVFALWAALIATVLVTLDAVGSFDIQPNNIWMMGLATTVAVVIAYFNLMFNIPIKPYWGKLLKNVALGVSLLDAGTIMLFCVLTERLNHRQEISIAMFFAMVLFVLVTMTFVIAFKSAIDAIKIRRTDLPTQFSYAQLQVQCPHCQTTQLLTETGQQCCQCGLQFHFRMAEPHCPECEYLLIGQSTGTCPECGHPLAENIGKRLGEPA